MTTLSVLNRSHMTGPGSQTTTGWDRNFIMGVSIYRIESKKFSRKIKYLFIDNTKNRRATTEVGPCCTEFLFLTFLSRKSDQKDHIDTVQPFDVTRPEYLQ